MHAINVSLTTIILFSIILLVQAEIVDYDAKIEKDALTKTDSNNEAEYVIVKIPISSIENRRHKRFIGGLLAGATAFIVKSGIWSAFKLSCIEFLKFTGGALIGEIYDKYHSTKIRKRRGIDILPENEVPIEITDQDFSDGCNSEFGCFNYELNQTLGKVFQQISTIPKGICRADGFIALNSRRDNIYLPDKFYHHEFRSKCFPAEVMCLVLLKVEVLMGQGALLGCNSCGGIQLKFEFAIFNVSSIQEASYCNYVDGLLGMNEPSAVPRGTRFIEYDRLVAQMKVDLRPTPLVQKYVLNKTIAIEIMDNDRAVNDILN